MSSPQFGLEALVLGIPAVALLVAAFFRLDEMFSKPHSGTGIGHPLSHRGEDGEVVCIEPDGRYSVVEGTGRGLAQRRSGHIPKRGDAGAVRQVSVEWVRDGSGE